MRNGFARHGARATALLAPLRRSRADVVVCDEADFGAMIAAERLGLPYASVVVIAAGSFLRHDLIAEPLHELRAEHGLPSDPELAMLSRHLVLCPVPPSFRDPAFPLPSTGRYIRPWAVGRRESHDPPLVYFTLGTAFTLEVGDLYTRVLAGLAELPAQVVVTIGGRLDPAELGPQPPNVRVERFRVQAALMPICDLVVCHGGSGSVIGALAYGLPLVVLPLGADQSHNADRVEALGAGLVLDAVDATPEDVRDAAAAVLADPSYRLAAERLADECAALPGPEHAVSLLDKIVSGH